LLNGNVSRVTYAVFLFFLWEKRLLQSLSVKAKQPVISTTFGQYRFIRKSTGDSTFVLGLGLFYLVLCALFE